MPCRSDMCKNDSDCVAEFINLISSESNEICSKEEKRTIAPEHVLRALEVFFLSPFPLPFICAFVLHSCPENCFLFRMSPWDLVELNSNSARKSNYALHVLSSGIKPNSCFSLLDTEHVEFLWPSSSLIIFSSSQFGADFGVWWISSRSPSCIWATQKWDNGEAPFFLLEDVGSKDTQRNSWNAWKLCTVHWGTHYPFCFLGYL